MFHELKILPEHFEPVMAGIKLAELRLNDRDFREDDTLCLREYENGEYTGRIVYRRVIHVADVGAYLPGYVLLSMGGLIVFSDINAAIEEAIWRRYNGGQQRHFCLVQRGNMIAVVQDRDNKYPNAMWTTRNFVG